MNEPTQDTDSTTNIRDLELKAEVRLLILLGQSQASSVDCANLSQAYLNLQKGILCRKASTLCSSPGMKTLMQIVKDVNAINKPAADKSSNQSNQ